MWCPQGDSNPRSRLEGPRKRFSADYAEVCRSYQGCYKSALVADFQAFVVCRECPPVIRNHHPYSNQKATRSRGSRQWSCGAVPKSREHSPDSRQKDPPGT
jgi:hypothetical protein